MKIAMMTNNYKPYIGGVPISIERLADGLRKNGHTVYIFAPDYKDNGVDDDFTIRYSTTNHSVAKIIPLPRLFDAAFQSTFNHLDIDIIHVHHPVLISRIALRLGKKNRIPVVFTYHTRYEQYFHYWKPYGFVERRAFSKHKAAQKIVETVREDITPAYMNRFMGKCEMVFAPTKTIKEYLLQKDAPVTVEILPTGLPKNSFELHEGSAALRERYIQNKKYLFCSVSRLAKEKNLPFLFQGLAILKKQMGDCFRLLLIGDGPEKSNLQAEADRLGLRDTVIFAGSIPNEKIPCCHQASDLFLFTSTSETQGIVLLEAMAAEAPVVAVKASGVQDVLVHGANGMMSGENATEWSRMISAVLSDNDLYQELQKGARQTALEYSNEHIAQAAVSHYQKALEGKEFAGRVEEKIKLPAS